MFTNKTKRAKTKATKTYEKLKINLGKPYWWLRKMWNLPNILTSMPKDNRSSGSRDMLADGQTDRRVDHNSLHPYRGAVINLRQY